MKLNFKWITDTREYSTGQSLYLNRLCVGSYSYNAARSQGTHNNNDYVGYISLPQLKTDRVYDDSTEVIKSKIEQIVTSWFTEALKGSK